MKWSREGHKSTEPQSRIENTTCCPHRLHNHEPERDGFQHVKILREYCKKWHAVGGYMIFWFTREFCKVPQSLSWQINKDYYGHPHLAGDFQVSQPAKTSSRALQVLMTNLSTCDIS